jgi:hypothetical protein
MIGVRATWFCALCRTRESTYQLVLGAAAIKLDPPARWHFEDGLTICGDHGDRHADAARQAA